jgi:hypothetical protein
MRALEYAFDHIWQLPYRRLGPNSNTYAHALLKVSYMKLADYSVDQCFPPLSFPKTLDSPENAAGWNSSGYGNTIEGMPKPPKRR